MGCPYDAVGMQRALDSAIGLPRRSTSASWMLVFLMPADVRRNLMMPRAAHHREGSGRGGGTRTRDLVLPKHVRCQATLLPAGFVLSEAR